MPRNTCVLALSVDDDVGASMRPRRDAAEYRGSKRNVCRNRCASMRPRRDAAEYLF